MSFKPGRYYVCDICGMGTFVDDRAFAEQDPFPEGWVNLRSQLRTSGRYRSASAMESIDATRRNKDTTTELNLDICDNCWMMKTIGINDIFKKRKKQAEEESKTLH